MRIRTLVSQTPVSHHRRRALGFAAGAVCGAALAPARAQAYPSRPIRIVIPYATGASGDIVGRLIGPYLSESMGQPVVIDNRPGGGGVLGADVVAKSAADGYTLLMGSPGPITVNPSMMASVPYVVKRDLAPVTLIATVPSILLVNPKLPVKSVRELIAYAKANPGALSYASAGNGSVPHLTGELFKLSAEVNMVHVPYKGSGPAITDLLGGHVALFFDNMPSGLPYVKSGKLRGLAVTSPKRSDQMPDLPTMSESGVPGFEAYSWAGLLTPVGTPADVIARIAREVGQVLAKPEVREKLRATGAEIVGNSPAEFTDFIDREAAKWARVIKAGNIKS